jgi:hypothetical protein
MRFSACFFAMLLSAVGAMAAPTTVPFVGCPANGQTGAIAAPKGKPVAVELEPALAGRLAFYQAEGLGVLAPRGWHCALLYGSSGSFLLATPDPIRLDDYFDVSKTVAGPAVQVGYNYGGTSGRSAVAALVARYFPQREDFVRSVVELEKTFGSKRPYPTGPFPGDKPVTRKKTVVEFVTPANAKGLGTVGRLKPDDEPIYAAAMLLGEADEPDTVTAAVRLPKEDAELAWAIVRDLERRHCKTKTAP